MKDWEQSNVELAVENAAGRQNFRPPDYAAFFRAAHRAFISADSRFLAAGLIGLRFDVAFFGAALPFSCAHRFFMASEMRFRAVALMCLLPADLGGRPRRAGTEASPTSALIAFSMRRSSSLSSATML